MANDYLTGDTVRVRVVFKDSLNALADPDSNTAYFTVYDADDISSILTNGLVATRSSVGNYYYDFTLPDNPMKLVFEMKGLFATKPQVERTTVRVRFKP